jgi:serine/threonine-protein kinase
MVLGGKYRVERVLGSGAMGVVVLARHVELEQPVAIKILRPELAEYLDVSVRFRDEAKATAAIRSEHAVRVFDVSAPGVSPPYILMERLRGVDLDAVLEQGPLPVPDAVDYLLQACAGVASAHALGIVHRDLKPANLFLAEREGGGHIVKVLDFGIAKSLLGDTRLLRATITGDIKGTPAFMSPEQLDAPGDVDTRTDIWALGAIFCELVTGELPFTAETVPGLCAKILKEPPLRPSRLRHGLPPEVDTIVLRCLQKNQGDRYATVADLAEALAPLAATDAQERVARVRAALSRVPGETDAPAGGLKVPTSPAFAPRKPTPAAFAPRVPTPPAFDVPATDSATVLHPVRKRASPLLVVGVVCGMLAIGALAAVVLGRSSSPGRAAAPTVTVTAAPPGSTLAGAATPSSAPPVPILAVSLDPLPSAASVTSAPPAPAAVPGRTVPARGGAGATGRQPTDEDKEFGGRK